MSREKELLKIFPSKKDSVISPDLSKKKSHPWYLILSMLIPVVLFYLIYVAKGEHPFGDGSVLVLDLNAQYVWFFEALRNFVRGDAELLYSFSRALGGEFFGIYAYYLASPLSYLLCLFPQEKMLEGLLALFLLKAGLSGFTFGFYMHRTLNPVKPYAIVMFSTLYAMTSYAVVQQHNTMWIDAMIWLPIITLGIEELIKHGKFKLYTISLAIAIFSNFYIGYMVCIYCFLYFFLYYFAHSGNGNNPHKEQYHFIKSFFRIAFYSLIALCATALIILAAYYSLNFGKSTFSSPSWEWNINFDILDLLYKFLPGSYDTVRPVGLPFVYCGLLTLLLLPAYFLSKKYPMRQKIVSAVFILILVASFTFSVTDLVWHVFQKPNWLNHRYSFMLCFYLCVLGCRAFADFEGISLKTTLGTAGFIALICVLLQKHQSGEYVDPNDYTTIWFTLLALVVYLAILAILRSSTNKQVVSAVLISAVSIEVFLSGLWNLNGLGDDVGYSKYSYYNNFLNKARPIVEEVQESDTSFYRMEKTFFRTTNDNMALNIRGLSGSTSTLNKETIQFLNKMGYASKSHWSKYLGGTPVNDSLLGIKYVISDNSVYKNYYEVYKTDSVNKYTAYYNPYALSIAYGVDEDILDFPLGFVTEIGDAEEEEEQGRIEELIAAVKGKINEILNIDETVNSAEYQDEYFSPFERLNAIVSAMLGEEETLEIFVPIRVEQVETLNLKKGYYVNHIGYQPIDPEKEATLSYTITMPSDAELYFYLPSGAQREVSLTLRNGDLVEKKGTFGGNESVRIISLGTQAEETELTLSMTLKDDKLFPMTKQECFYYIDWAVFEDAMARLAENQYQITNYTESSFEGTYTTSKESELVMTTIAYDKGWKVYVDGAEVETIKALGSLVAFRIEGDAGAVHNVEIVYSPEVIGIGLKISLVAIGLLLLLILLERPLKKVPVLRALVSVPAQSHEEGPHSLEISEYPLDPKTFRYAPAKDRKPPQNKNTP